MILGDVMVPGKSLRCNVCKHIWISIASILPPCCPNPDCRSREWNGKKTRRKPRRGPAIELPKPKRIKWEVDDDF